MAGTENIEARRSLMRIKTGVIVFVLMCALQGCGVAKRVNRTSETDALLRAASAGTADTVRALHDETVRVHTQTGAGK